MQNLLRLRAEQELKTRARAREQLIEFTAYTKPDYATAPHHRQIAAALERVERGEVDRLMLMLPPRHGKSELASRRFPAFALGRNPKRQFISVSATSDLATDFGREVRNIMSGQEYRALFPHVEMAADSQAKGKWHTQAGGIYYAVGIGGAVLGKGADILLIDDPFASMEDALSETTREAVWNWYTGSAYNRLMPGGAIVVIGHRMAEDDLQGRLLSQQVAGGDTWEVVELPAISDDGEALWPAAYPIEALERIRRNTLPRFWSALYQQHPTPDEGSYFLKSWFRWFDTPPARDTLHVYGASDYAVTADGGDWTVHVVAGVDPDDNLYVLDMWRQRTASDRWIEALLDLADQWRPMDWAEEQGQILKSIGPFLEQRANERRTYFSRQQFVSVRDKATRAQSIRARMAMGKVYLPKNAPWTTDLVSELLSFPAGKHDDQCVAEGTLITMADGAERPIEAIQVGDLVATPEGPCEVSASAVTAEAAEVFEITFSDGKTLVATGNHPVYVQGRGFVRVDTLAIMDVVQTLGAQPWHAAARQKQKWSSIAAIVTGAIRTANTCITRAITMRPNHGAASSIGIFGKMLTGQFQRAIRSITLTKTRPTTGWKIWSAFQPLSTVGNIPWTPTSMSGRCGTLKASGPRQRNGTPAKPALSGIAPTAKPDGPSGNRSSASASVVVGRFWHGLRKHSSAAKPAVSITGLKVLDRPARVRNITVRDAHVYYANGVLTHNCDALALLGRLLDDMVAGARPTAPKKPTDRWARTFGNTDDHDSWKVA
jgi:predicted phage terminase large subunit-like protein